MKNDDSGETAEVEGGVLGNSWPVHHEDLVCIHRLDDSNGGACAYSYSPSEASMVIKLVLPTLQYLKIPNKGVCV